MARKRMIDPEFWSDEEIGTWSFQARLFYIGLWNFADDKGRFKAHGKLLKSQIFPYDDRINIEALKKEISIKIQWYNVGGFSYGHIRNFLKYQRIDRPTASKLPEPKALDESSTNPREQLVPNIREEKLREEKLSMPVIYLNEKAKTNYNAFIETTQKLVKARFDEGRTLEEFKKVIDLKCKQWINDEKMAQYLRPKTLFNAGNFESYLNEPEVKDERTKLGIFRDTEV